MKKNKTVEYGKYGLLFLIPFFLVFLVFQLYPLLYTFYNSLIYSAKNGRYVTKIIKSSAAKAEAHRTLKIEQYRKTCNGTYFRVGKTR